MTCLLAAAGSPAGDDAAAGPPALPVAGPAVGPAAEGGLDSPLLHRRSSPVNARLGDGIKQAGSDQGVVDCVLADVGDAGTSAGSAHDHDPGGPGPCIGGEVGSAQVAALEEVLQSEIAGGVLRTSGRGERAECWLDSAPRDGGSDSVAEDKVCLGSAPLNSEAAISGAALLAVCANNSAIWFHLKHLISL